MLEDKKRYLTLLVKVAALLSINVVPSLDSAVSQFGGDRFKEEIQKYSMEYQVCLFVLYNVENPSIP